MVINGRNAIEPLYSQPPKSLFTLSRSIGTPAIIYDQVGMKDVVNRMQEDFSLLSNAKLNLAVKAIHTPELLRLYAEWGLGCDVASIGEYELAKKAGFSEITTTNPAYSEKDMGFFHDEDVVLDLDSQSQVKSYGSLYPGTEIGLRIRIPLPPELESNATFGNDSRFGIDILQPGLNEILEKYNLSVTRLHVHTGQMTPESLLFKADYLLAIAEVFEDVHTIDFGGGLFHFYISREKARKSLTMVNGKIKEWVRKNKRTLMTRFEPGGALLAGCGYLVSTIVANEFHSHFNSRIVTVDASAWNLAPWHKPEVMILGDNNDKRIQENKALIAGNTLYEGDFFGKQGNGQLTYFDLDDPHIGEKILFTASGAYTMTNSRRFNRLPLPKEYLLNDDDLKQVGVLQ
ncbi:diaminopimelate decarboxylase family protein [Rossellomorea marisflavi]|uniref:Uncharacterized protein n=1 Tax=Rossellomorea marisflavi TaxID=189381 RepID=A0A163LVF4_9BACI|nr:hypothetical protein [Rossellomorea marisflavi]KZE51151.1 hypothetical protein AV649_17470 [Rossellomorea marisflavi]TYO68869.1 hypothetical protein DQ398_004060 [Rossellomorea marisflavi]UKS66010.1 hypothetical protein K6T23_03820 [Rossellomorea marisflavi]